MKLKCSRLKEPLITKVNEWTKYFKMKITGVDCTFLRYETQNDRDIKIQ